VTSAKSREPTIIIQSEEPSMPEDFLGPHKEFTDALLDVYVRQLRLMHAMMVELPLAWAAAREEVPPPTETDAPLAFSPAASPANIAHGEAKELLPATRKRKKSASGEIKVRKTKSASPSTGDKPSHKGGTKRSAPPSLH
jgi:hypothetical protein